VGRFKDADEVYATLGQLFRHARVEDCPPDAWPMVHASPD
jgi:hypothetical protein